MESALVQTLVAGTLVLGAVLFLGRRAWRTIMISRRGADQGGSCGDGGACGCAGTANATEARSLTPSRRQ